MSTERHVPGDDWDLAEEVAGRESRRAAIAANDELLRHIPYPRFTPKGCVDGAHHMRRDAAGLRAWQCVRCAKRQPFNVDGAQ